MMVSSPQRQRTVMRMRTPTLALQVITLMTVMGVGGLLVTLTCMHTQTMMATPAPMSALSVAQRVMTTST